MNVANDSVLDNAVYEKIVDWLCQWKVIHNSHPEYWLGASIFYSVVSFVLLWIDVGYWPWWLFVILWVLTEASIIFTSIASRLRDVQTKSIAYDTIMWAHVSFSTHASVLGALHVLDSNAWATLIVTMMVGLRIYAPHWLAMKTQTIYCGKWTSASEIRFFSTSVALLLSPVHQKIHGSIIGSVCGIAVSLLLAFPIASYVRTATSMEIGSVRFVITLHFLVATVPFFGMAMWTWIDAWLASAVPVTFAGILVFINTELAARTHYDYRANMRTTILTMLDFVPLAGMIISYFNLLPQPLSIVIIYMVSVCLTCLFLVRISVRKNKP